MADRLGLVAAAAALGKNRKTLQRWRQRQGAPFSADGSVDLVELKAWASAQGLLERDQESGPRTGVERALGEAAAARGAAPPPAVAKAAAAVQKASAELSDLDEDGQRFLRALETDDRAVMLRLGVTDAVPASLVKKIEAMGKARIALADANKRELDNQQRRRELVVAAEVGALATQAVEVAKAHLEAMPGKLTPRLVGQGHDTIIGALENEVRSLLTTLQDAFMRLG